jgi:sugar phosphate isomerase/epimerase
VRAGVDPAPWIKRYAGRIPAVHVKDVAPGDDLTVEGGWADVGEGVVNWSLLWELAVQAGSELMVVEHDAPSDYKRFATRSIAAMKRLAGVA